jgi:hypothetical protein
MAKRQIAMIDARIEMLNADLEWLLLHPHAPDVDPVLEIVKSQLEAQKGERQSWNDFGHAFGCW